MRRAVVLPAVWGMWGKLWGMVWGSKSLISKGCGVCGVSAITGACACACTHMRAGVRMCVQVHSPHAPHTPHTQYLRRFHTPQHAQHMPHTNFIKGNEMVERAKRVIACTQENAVQMQRVVKKWPQLHSLVKGLQEQGVFPGLRGLQITLTGDAQTVAKGLDALEAENSVLARSDSTQGAGEAVCS